MKRIIHITSAVCFFSVGLLHAQSGEWNVAAVVRGTITTSSKIYPNPNSPSFDLRTVTTPYNSVLGLGGELRIQRFGTNFYFSVSAEYLSQVRSEQRLDGSINPPRRVPVEEGYRLIPLEISGYIYVPIGSQSWKLSMGGGLGAYYTERIYRIAGVTASPVGNRFGYGIHVGINTEYSIIPRLSVLAGLKFRDPEVDVRNKFEVSSIPYGTGVIAFPQGEFPSRINVDGMTFSVGVRFDIL